MINETDDKILCTFETRKVRQTKKKQTETQNGGGKRKKKNRKRKDKFRERERGRMIIEIRLDLFNQLPVVGHDYVASSPPHTQNTLKHNTRDSV